MVIKGKTLILISSFLQVRLGKSTRKCFVILCKPSIYLYVNICLLYYHQAVVSPSPLLVSSHKDTDSSFLLWFFRAQHYHHYVKIITGPGTCGLGRGVSGLNFRRSCTFQSLMYLCSRQMWGECLGCLPRWVEVRSKTVLFAVDSSIPRKFAGTNWCSINVC